MMTLSDVAARYSLTEKQARRRWEALSPLLAQFAQRGPHNTIMLSPQALAVFDRLTDLLKSGLSLPSAAGQLREEMRGSGQTQTDLAGSKGSPAPHDDLLPILKEQLTAKDHLIEQLLAQLRDRDEQLRALMPGPVANGKSGSSSRPSLTRWNALRFALLGR
jgi:hypothetical protein